MRTTTSVLRRGGATLSVLALSFAGLAFVAPTASATETGDVDGGVLVWGLSDYLNTTATGSIGPLAAGYVAPATYDAATKLSTFTVDSAEVESDGSAVIALDGASLNYAPTGNRWLKFDDLVVDVDGDGNGTVSALASYGPGVGTYPSSSYDPSVAPFRGPTRVDLVDLVGNTASENAATAEAFTFPALDGTWSADLIAFLEGDSSADPAVPGLSYRSQLVNDDPSKAPKPLSITLERATPTVEVEVAATVVNGKVAVEVTGDGFRAVTNSTPPPADAGVYVAIAEAGEFPDTSDRDSIGLFPAVDWVMPAQMANGLFKKTFGVPVEKLDPTKDYAVYTWQAHTHSNTSQDTETPFAINFDALSVSAPKVTGATSKVYGAASRFSVEVPASGTVTLTGLGAPVVRSASGGVATFSVPATVMPGRYTANFAYSGTGWIKPSRVQSTLTVAKATPTLATRWVKKLKRGKKSVLVAKVTGPATVAAPTGKVKVLLKKGKKKVAVKAVPLRNGQARLVVTKKQAKKLTRGKWQVTTTYTGSGLFNVATKGGKLRVK